MYGRPIYVYVNLEAQFITNDESFLFMIGDCLHFSGFGLILQINSLASELVV